MQGIDECGRPSTVPTENTAMTRVIACLRRICVDSTDTLVPDTQSDTHLVSLLALENIVLPIVFIPPVRARATAFVDLLIEFMDQVRGFRTFRPDFKTFIVQTFRSEIDIVVNQIFSVSQGTVPIVPLET